MISQELMTAIKDYIIFRKEKDRLYKVWQDTSKSAEQAKNTYYEYDKVNNEICQKYYKAVDKECENNEIY